MLGKFTREDQSHTVEVESELVMFEEGKGLTYEVWISREEMVDFLL